eukprot:7864551-Pyramimonas_sp.AAC.2
MEPTAWHTINSAHKSGRTSWCGQACGHGLWYATPSAPWRCQRGLLTPVSSSRSSGSFNRWWLQSTVYRLFNDRLLDAFDKSIHPVEHVGGEALGRLHLTKLRVLT